MNTSAQTIQREEYLLIDKPFKRGLFSRFLTSLLKRRIIRYWTKGKADLKRRMMRDGVSSDEQFLRYAIDFYNDFKPLLFRSYSEEYPHREPTVSDMRRWIADCTFSSELLGRTKDRNVWIDIYNFYEMLTDADLLPTDGGYLC